MNPPPSQVIEEKASPEIRKGGRRREHDIEKPAPEASYPCHGRLEY